MVIVVLVGSSVRALIRPLKIPTTIDGSTISSMVRMLDTSKKLLQFNFLYQNDSRLFVPCGNLSHPIALRSAVWFGVDNRGCFRGLRVRSPVSHRKPVPTDGPRSAVPVARNADANPEKHRRVGVGRFISLPPSVVCGATSRRMRFR